MIINSVLAAQLQKGRTIIEVSELPIPQTSDLNQIYHVVNETSRTDEYYIGILNTETNEVIFELVNKDLITIVSSVREVTELPEPQDSDLNQIYHLKSEPFAIGSGLPSTLYFNTLVTPSVDTASEAFLITPILIAGSTTSNVEDLARNADTDPTCIVMKATQVLSSNPVSYVQVIVAGYLPNGMSNPATGVGRCIYAQGAGVIVDENDNGTLVDITYVNKLLDELCAGENQAPIPHISRFGWQGDGTFDCSAVAGTPITQILNLEKIIDQPVTDEYYIGVASNKEKGTLLAIGDPLPEVLFYDTSISQPGLGADGNGKNESVNLLSNGSTYTIQKWCQKDTTNNKYDGLIVAQVSDENGTVIPNKSQVLYIYSDTSTLNDIANADPETFGLAGGPITEFGWQGDGLISTGDAAGTIITELNDSDGIFAKPGKIEFELININAFERIIEVRKLPEPSLENTDTIYHLKKAAKIPELGQPMPAVLYCDKSVVYDVIMNLVIEVLALTSGSSDADPVVEKVIFANNDSTYILGEQIEFLNSSSSSSGLQIMGMLGEITRSSLSSSASRTVRPLYVMAIGMTIDEVNAKLAPSGIPAISNFGWQMDGILDLSAYSDTTIDLLNDKENLLLLEKSDNAYYIGSEAIAKGEKVKNPTTDPNTNATIFDIFSSGDNALYFDTSITPSYIPTGSSSGIGEPIMTAYSASEMFAIACMRGSASGADVSEDNFINLWYVMTAENVNNNPSNIKFQWIYADAKGEFAPGIECTPEFLTTYLRILFLALGSDAGISINIPPIDKLGCWYTDHFKFSIKSDLQVEELFLTDEENFIHHGLITPNFKLINADKIKAVYEGQIEQANSTIATLNAEKETLNTETQKIQSEKQQAIDTIKRITDGTINTLVIPDTTASIRNRAFQDCSQLSEITIPISVTDVGNEAFNGCNKLADIYYKGSKEQYDTLIIGTDNKPFVDARKHYYSDTEPPFEGADTEQGSYCTSYDDNYWRIVDEKRLIWGEDPSIGLACARTESNDLNLASIDITDTYKIVGRGTCKDKILIFPHLYKDKPIIFIAQEAFNANSSNGTPSPTKVTISEGILEIGYRAFYNAKELRMIILPASLKSISSRVFESCNVLTDIYYKGTADQWVQIYFNDTILYNNRKLYINDELLTEAAITTAKKINNSAFCSYNSLTNVTIGNSVTSIGDMAFSSCSNLTSVTIPSSVTSIGVYAFGSCSNLASVNYTGTIDEWVQIDFVDNYGDYSSNPLYYAKNLYINNQLLTETNITVATQIKNGVFYSYKGLTSILISDSVTSIGDDAFRYCSNLTNVTIGNNVTSIGHAAFEYCRSLADVTIGNKVTFIGNSAFRYCSNLTNIIIPDSVTNIDSYALNNCQHLTTIHVDENNQNYKSIDGNLYSKDGKVLLQYAIGKTSSSFIIPDNVTTISDYAFNNCNQLQSIYIPSTVTTINASSANNNPFNSCSSELQIYTDVESASVKPSTWGAYWDNYSSSGKLNVHYGISKEQYECEISESGHQFGEPQTFEPTCIESGETIRICARCGYRESTTIPALGHNRGYDGLCTQCGEAIPLYTIINDTAYPFSNVDNILNSTNKAHNSVSNYKITANADMTVAFEYNVSSESNCDWLYILKDTTELVKKSGTTNSYTPLSVTLRTGETLTFRYKKDGSVASGNDCCYIRNLDCQPILPENIVQQSDSEITVESAIATQSGTELTIG